MTRPKQTIKIKDGRRVFCYLGDTDHPFQAFACARSSKEAAELIHGGIKAARSQDVKVDKTELKKYSDRSMLVVPGFGRVRALEVCAKIKFLGISEFEDA